MTTVNVDFSNTGNEIITVKYANPAGVAQTDIVLRPNQIIRREMDINFSYFFTFTRGRFDQTAAWVFFYYISAA